MFLRRKRVWLPVVIVLLSTAVWLTWHRVNEVRLTSRVYRMGWQVDPPFQTLGADGRPIGLAVDLVREAARRRGIRLEWVMHPEGAQNALVAKSVDLWPFVTILPDRAGLLHITEPYLETELSILVAANSNFRQLRDLATARISFHEMPVHRRWFRATLSQAREVPMPTTRDAVTELCEGRADAAFLEEYNSIETLLAGGSCSFPMRWIAVPETRPRLGIGSTFEKAAVADALREEIGLMADDGGLQSALGQWGYMSGLHLRTVHELVNAGRRETRLKLGIVLFALLLVLSLWLAVRIGRERDRTVRAERAQRGTEEKLRLMANNSTEMVLAYDMNRKLVYVNPAIERLVGYSAAELENAGFIDWTHPDDRARMHAHWDGLYQGKSFREQEYRLIAKDRSVKWASATWGPILDDNGLQVGVQGHERDITEQKTAEEGLRESERRFRSLLENVQLAAVIVDLEGLVTFCNDYLLSVTGWSRAEVMGRPLTQILAAEHGSQVLNILELLQTDSAGSHWSAEPEVHTKDGKVRRLQASSLVLRDSDGKPLGVAVIGADITEHRALQEQYWHAQKMEGLGRLAGSVAHDFNNLLTVINGYSEIIFRKLRDGDPLRPGTDQIRKAGARAADLTQQLLAFSRKQVIQPKPLDLNLVVSDSENMWARLLGENIRLANRLSPNLGQVLADDGQMHQVLMNLVVNARDAMPNGGTLTIATSNVEVDLSTAKMGPDAANGPHVLLEVADTGLGISEEVRQHIFEPFFTTKPQGEGSGLGLATVYGIVKQSQGWIDVRSQPGRGTSFRIFLPRIRSEKAADAAAQGADPVAASSETILLVEDQDEVRRFAKEVLEEQGYRILEAPAAPAALALAEGHSGPIHLLLTDVALPGMNGAELAERFAEIRPASRILFTSGYTSEVSALRTILSSGLAFLPKPYSPHVMAARVREILDQPVESKS